MLRPSMAGSAGQNILTPRARVLRSADVAPGGPTPTRRPAAESARNRAGAVSVGARAAISTTTVSTLLEAELFAGVESTEAEAMLAALVTTCGVALFGTITSIVIWPVDPAASSSRRHDTALPTALHVKS